MRESRDKRRWFWGVCRVSKTQKAGKESGAFVRAGASRTHASGSRCDRPRAPAIYVAHEQARARPTGNKWNTLLILGLQRTCAPADPFSNTRGTNHPGVIRPGLGHIAFRSRQQAQRDAGGYKFQQESKRKPPMDLSLASNLCRWANGRAILTLFFFSGLGKATEPAGYCRGQGGLLGWVPHANTRKLTIILPDRAKPPRSCSFRRRRRLRGARRPSRHKRP